VADKFKQKLADTKKKLKLEQDKEVVKATKLAEEKAKQLVEDAEKLKAKAEKEKIKADKKIADLKKLEAKKALEEKEAIEKKIADKKIVEEKKLAEKKTINDKFVTEYDKKVLETLDKIKDTYKVKPWKHDVVEMADPKNQEIYDALVKEYSDLDAEGKFDPKKVITKECSEVFRGLEEWQDSTTKARAMAFKIKSATMEGRDLDELLFRYNVPTIESSLRFLDEMSDLEYLKLRAANQVFMKSKGIDSVELFRGTDGPEGKEISDLLKSEKGDTAIFKDNIVNGYTDTVTVADGFGTRRDGITVRETVPKEDIIVHTDLLKGITKMYEKEREYVVFSDAEKVIDIKDVKLKGKDFGVTF